MKLIYRIFANGSMITESATTQPPEELKFQWDAKVYCFESMHATEGELILKKIPVQEKEKQPPYSEKDYQDAKSQGLDLDNWNDYERYYQLGEQEEEY